MIDEKITNSFDLLKFVKKQRDLYNCAAGMSGQAERNKYLLTALLEIEIFKLEKEMEK